jgi:hypothetical protein
MEQTSTRTDTVFWRGDVLHNGRVELRTVTPINVSPTSDVIIKIRRQIMDAITQITLPLGSYT